MPCSMLAARPASDSGCQESLALSWREHSTRSYHHSCRVGSLNTERKGTRNVSYNIENFEVEARQYVSN